jgi:ABC-type uncharacterized transport system ATPase subunit
MRESLFMANEAPILVMEHISKSFPGVQALNDVTFEVKRGEIHALVGGERRRQVHPDEDPHRGHP